MKNQNVQFDVTRAIQTRQQNALDTKGLTVKDLIDQTVATVVCNIKIYSSANEVETDEDFVRMMRNLGGFTSMIETAIGRQPFADRNDLGFANNPDWWIWKMKMDLSDRIREAVQLRLQN